MRALEHLGVWVIPDGEGKWNVMVVEGLAADSEAAAWGKDVVHRLSEHWKSAPQVGGIIISLVFSAFANPLLVQILLLCDELPTFCSSGCRYTVLGELLSYRAG